MQTSLNSEILNRITFLTGNAGFVEQLTQTSALIPFHNEVVDFLNCVSKVLMDNKQSRQYSDVVTFAFWIRKSSVLKLKERFNDCINDIRVGRGVAFHIAPSNVPVNFAYSLVTSLLLGNANIVRVPSRKFPQVDILVDAFNSALSLFEGLKPYIVLVRYNRDKDINDLLSSIADVRIVWGGDATIAELRQSPLQPRAVEVSFADRYSLAVINSDSYVAIENKTKVAEQFYNDTFLTDQNACTSPRIVVWTGDNIAQAKELFWKEEHKIVKEKYVFQAIQGVNKLTSSCLVAVAENGVKVEPHSDNLIVRVSVPHISRNLMNFRDNSGYFYEYDCEDITTIADFCNDKRCQTIVYLGEKEMFSPLVLKGIKGVDRIVPIGSSMDFDLIWDGYNLPSFLTRTIVIR